VYSRIVGTGSYLPASIVTNFDLEKRMDTSDIWIRERTGIECRHIAAEGESNVDMAEHASRAAIAAAGLQPADIDLISYGTTTPDLVFPNAGALLQARLGNRGAPAFSLEAACSGFIYALAVADKFVRTGSARRALVVGSEILSRITDQSDRSTAGSEVFKLAVTLLGRVVDETLAANHLEQSAIDWLVPHQANLRIIQATARKLGLPMERVIVTVQSHGNTSTASVPLALDVGVRDGRVKRGDLLLLEALGGGLTWGSALLRY